MRAVIVDSGLDKGLVEQYKNVEGVTVSPVGENNIIVGTYEDEVGHGTAVTDIFTSNVEGEYELFVVKIFGASFKTTSEHLCLALEYVNEHVECELILISSGIRLNENGARLSEVIKTLVDKNVVIVSAYDNSGAMSYPAAYLGVIGVDVSGEFTKKELFMVRENSPVDVVGSESNFRVNWLGGKKTILKGSSFTAAYIAAVVMNHIIECSKKITVSECMEALKKKSVRSICFKKETLQQSAKEFMSDVKKAIVFPFNKEVHSLAAFESLLSMDMVGYYDIRQSGMVGMRICEVTKHIQNQKIIGNYEHIEWESDFDMVVLGHTEQLSKMLNVDLAQWFVEKCKMHEKKIYCFDDIESLLAGNLATGQYYVPSVKPMGIVARNRGKLFLSNKPVLGVFGTSSKQGKYTLQLMLREMFLKNGYQVSQVGTEPTGYMFGFDYVYPMGYNSSVYVGGNEAIATLNKMMYDCECQESDITIVGCQSMTVPLVNYNISYITLPQTEFILGVQPDVVVLCVNLHDDFLYIERTIGFVQGICNAEVIGFCVFPRKIVIDDVGSVRKNREVVEFEYEQFKKKLESRWGKPVFCLGQYADVEELFDVIIKKLT